mmetsp:Transcript_34199/g.61313  ORF Transcript_34199/g.61313 Transcript_34199/m.61313 type:complete len:312 (-) Transcript_34199:824-1759(-)
MVIRFSGYANITPAALDVEGPVPQVETTFHANQVVDSQLIQHLQDLQRTVASIRAHDDQLGRVRVGILGLDLFQEIQIGLLLDCLPAQRGVITELTIDQRDVDAALANLDGTLLVTLTLGPDVHNIIAIEFPQDPCLVRAGDTFVGVSSIESLRSIVNVIMPRENHFGVLATLPVHDAAAHAEHSNAAGGRGTSLLPILPLNGVIHGGQVVLETVHHLEASTRGVHTTSGNSVAFAIHVVVHLCGHTNITPATLGIEGPVPVVVTTLHANQMIDSKVIQQLQDLQRPVAPIRAHDNDFCLIGVREPCLELV